MKKIILSTLALTALLSTSAFAKNAEFNAQVGQTDTAGVVTTDYGIGLGFTKYWGADTESGILTGGTIYLGGSSSTELYYGADFRLGYSYANVGIYGILTGTEQSIGTGTTAYGWGTGGGIEYKFEKFAIAGEYKAYSMKEGGVADYDMDQTNLVLKYRF